MRITLWAGLSAAVLLSAGCAVSRISVSADLARRSEPLQAAPETVTHRLLIIGDSTGVGTGASSPKGSVAGLIAQDHPDWAITNRAVDGAKFADLRKQLASGERFDTVLVMCGGNDVIRLTDMDDAQRDIRYVAERGLALAHRVVFMPSGNVGNAPFFYPPLSWWMDRRSRTLHAMIRQTAAATGAGYVNLYQPKAQDPFAQDPKQMNAADGLHPSDAGYVIWYDRLKAQASL